VLRFGGSLTKDERREREYMIPSNAEAGAMEIVNV